VPSSPPTAAESRAKSGGSSEKTHYSNRLALFAESVVLTDLIPVLLAKSVG
jgi:hypothetical protein